MWVFCPGKTNRPKIPAEHSRPFLAGIFELCPKIAKKKNFRSLRSRRYTINFPLSSLAEKLPVKIFPRALRAREFTFTARFARGTTTRKNVSRALRAREYTFSARFARGKTTRKNFYPRASRAGIVCNCFCIVFASEHNTKTITQYQALVKKLHPRAKRAENFSRFSSSPPYKKVRSRSKIPKIPPPTICF